MAIKIINQREVADRKHEIDEPHGRTILPTVETHAESHDSGDQKDAIEKRYFVVDWIVTFNGRGVRHVRGYKVRKKTSTYN